jgi:hypothetical protein
VYDLEGGAERCTGSLLNPGTPPLAGGLVHFAGSRMMMAEQGDAGKSR